MSAARLIVWRHGRTEWNHTGRFQGQADIPLDDHGRLQAAQTAPVLAELKPSQIVSSDLSRARDTAGALAAITGLEVTTDKRLREIAVGSWEGLTAAQVAEVDPELSRRYFEGEDVQRSSTGETAFQVATRVAEALQEIADAGEDGSTIVVAMHGLAARVGVCHLVGFPVDSWIRLGGLANCAWVSVERAHYGYWRIEEYNAQKWVEPAEPVS